MNKAGPQSALDVSVDCNKFKMSGIVASLSACFQCVKRPAFWTLLSYGAHCVSNFSNLPDDVIPLKVAQNETDCYEMYSGKQVGTKIPTTVATVDRSMTISSRIPHNGDADPVITQASAILIWAALVIIIVLLIGYIIYKKISSRRGNQGRLNLGGERGNELEMMNLQPFNARLARIQALNMQRQNQFDEIVVRQPNAGGAARATPLNHGGNGEGNNPGNVLIDLNDLEQEMQEDIPPPPPPPPPPQARGNPFATRHGLANLVAQNQRR